MLHESPHVCVSTADGIGTLWLSPPDGRIGTDVLRELLPAIELVEQTPGIEILVVRSGTPVGFGRGMTALSGFQGGEGGSGGNGNRLPLWQSPGVGNHPGDLLRLGQRATASLAGLSIPTVAFIEGPCIGPGLELALACEDRLAVAGPDSWVSFGEVPPGWGGQTRLRMRGVKMPDRVTAREAVRLGVFDHAFCDRRGKIELRSWLDRLQFHPRKRATPWRSWFVDAGAGFAAERQAFREAVGSGNDFVEMPTSIAPPRCVGLIGDNPLSRLLAAEFAMRGIGMVWVEGNTGGLFTKALRRGRLTPLEAEQATKRIRLTHDADALTACDWVALTDPHADLAALLERDLPPRAILCVPPAHIERVTLLASRPQRVAGLQMHGEAAALTECETSATVAGWLGLIGVNVTATEVAAVPAFV